jgi:ribosomal protein S27E
LIFYIHHLKKTVWLARKDELGITGSRKYPVFEDVKIKCVICGRIFIFATGEQKWYKGRGYSSPKRCPGCRENKYINDF